MTHNAGLEDTQTLLDLAIKSWSELLARNRQCYEFYLRGMLDWSENRTGRNMHPGE